MTDDEGQFSEAHHDDSSFGNLAFVADQKTNFTWTSFGKRAGPTPEVVTVAYLFQRVMKYRGSFGRRGPA